MTWNGWPGMRNYSDEELRFLSTRVHHPICGLTPCVVDDASEELDRRLHSELGNQDR